MRLAAQPRGRTKTLAAALAPGLLALVAWASSLAAIDVHELGDYGLLPELAPLWYTALAALVFGAVACTCARRPNGWLIAGYVAAVTIVLYATLPIVADAPPYPWTYKHIGVTRLIELQGQVDPSIDIYNRWPGMFALAAAFSELAGLPNPVSYAQWNEPLFALIDALLVAAIARAITRDVRVAGFAALVFTLGNWVGGQYFSPQAVAFALALVVMLLVLRGLRAGDTQSPRVVAALEHITRRRQPEHTLTDRLPWQPATVLAMVLAVYAVVVAAHQLTPYVLLLQVAALVFLAGMRPRWVVMAMAALAIGYLLPQLDYVERAYGLLSSANPFANVARPTDVYELDPVAGKRFNGRASVLLTFAVWGLSIVAALRLGRIGYARKALPILSVAFAPVAVLLVQSYGGEAALRVILFSLAWCATLIAWAVFTVEPRRLRISAASVVAVTLAALFVPAFHGAAQLHVVPGGEVRAAERFSVNAPAGSVLVSVATGFPGSVGPRYPSLGGRRETVPPNLLDEGDRFRHRPLGTGDVPAVIAAMRAHAPETFLAFSTTQRRYVETFRLMPRQAIERLERAVAESPDFRLWYATEDARIYRLRP